MIHSLNNVKSIEILLVEDNPGDVMLTKKALKSAKICNNVQIATDGEVAISMLKQEIPYTDFILPDIIFLDLNLPKKSGFEVLEEIQSSETLKEIPVIILSSSKAETDITKSYNLKASNYISKPITIQNFTEVVQSLDNFWFTIVVTHK